MYKRQGKEYHLTYTTAEDFILVPYSQIVKQNLKKGTYQFTISSFGYALWNGEVQIEKTGIFTQEGDNLYYTGQQIQLATFSDNEIIKWRSNN